MDQYLSEIMDQPVVSKKLYDDWTHDARLVELGQLYRQSPKPIIFLGMGSSHYAPIILRSRFSQAKIEFQIVEAGEFLHYEMEGIPDDAWLVAISQSGESIETRIAAEALKGRVERIIAITNESESSLAKLADTTLLLQAGREDGSTTKTFINTLLGLQVFANVIEGKEVITPQDVERFASTLSEIQMELLEKTKEVISYLGISSGNSPDPIHFITRGPTLATAQQAALILAETTDLFTMALAGGSFRHGPYELAGEQHRAVILAPSSKTQHLLVNMAKDLHEKGSKVVLISDTTEDVPCYKLSMPAIKEELAPLLYFLPIEMFGWNVATLRGRTPGMLRKMAKVTVVE